MSPTLCGTVQDGVIIPDSNEGLSNGARVRILPEEEPYPGFWEEHASLERASDEAFEMVLEMERQCG